MKISLKISEISIKIYENFSEKLCNFYKNLWKFVWKSEISIKKSMKISLKNWNFYKNLWKFLWKILKFL